MLKHIILGLLLPLGSSLSALAATNAIIAGQTTNGAVLIGQTNYYSFAGTSNGSVTITMVRTGGDGSYPAIDLIAPDGTNVGSWENSGLEWLAGVWTYPLPQNGGYVIQCRDNGETKVTRTPCRS